LNSWHILPSAQAQAAIAKLRHEDGFLHSGLDEDVSRWPPLMHYVPLLTKKSQGNEAWFNHPVYLQIVEEFVYGRNGTAALYPHKFHPLCPIPSMALVADMVSALDYIGSEAYHHCSLLLCLGSMKRVFT